MERQKNLNKYSKIFLYIIYLVGILGHLMPGTKSLMLLLTPIALLVTGAVVFANLYHRENKKMIIWFVIIYVITFVLEVIGVKTSLIFGDYSYGDVLGPNVFEVPLVIGFNWSIVIMGAIDLAKIVSKNKYLTLLLAASLAVCFDLILEPVAVKLGYWSWINGIPAQNYLAWFIISGVASYLFLKMSIDYKSDLPRINYLLQGAFFITILIFF